MDCCDHSSFLYRSCGTPKGAPVEPFWISSQHLIVELLRSCGISRECLKIDAVLPGLSDDPSDVVIILHIFVPGDAATRVDRRHLYQSGDPVVPFLILSCF